MPRKIRELIQDLKKAGFIDRGGKTGDDAKKDQERELERALREVKK